jgi:hypothetical protein
MNKVYKTITINYLRGMIETDGSVQLHLSGRNIKPIIKISQKTNTNVLALIKDFLNKKGISCQI